MNCLELNYMILLIRYDFASLAKLSVLDLMQTGRKLRYTVKPVLGGHSKIEKTKILMTNGSLMKGESIAECSPWSILQYF